MERESLATQIYNALIQSGPLTPEILSKLFRVDTKDVLEVLEELKSDGSVAEIGDNRYVALPKLSLVINRIEDLREKIRNLEAEIKSKVQKVGERVDSSYDAILNVLREKIEQLSNLLEKVLSDVTAQYKELIANNLEVLKSFSKMLEEVAVNLRGNIDSFRGREKAVQTELTEARDLLQSKALKEIDQLSRLTGEVFDELKKEYAESMLKNKAQLENEMKRIVDNITKSMLEITEGLKKLLEDLSQILDLVRENMENAFVSMLEDIQAEFEAIPDTLSKSMNETFERKSKELNEILVRFRDSVLSNLNLITSSEIEALRVLRTSVVEIVQKTEQFFNEISSGFIGSIGKHIDVSHNELLTRITEARENTIRSIVRLEESVKEGIASVKSLIDTAVVQLKDGLRTIFSEDIVDVVKKARTEIESIDLIPERVESDFGVILNKYKKSVDDLNSSLKNNVATFINSINSRLESISKSLTESIKNLESKPALELASKQASEMMANIIDRYVTRLIQDLERFGVEYLTDIQHVFISELDTLISDIKSRVGENDEVLEAIDESYRKAIQKIESAVKGRIKLLEELAADQKKTFSEGISEIINQTVDRIIKELQGSITKKLHDIELDIKNELVWIGSEIKSRLKVFAEKYIASLGEITGMLATDLSMVTTELRNEVNEKIESVSNAINSVGEKLQIFKDEYFKRIDELNEKLKEKVDTSFKVVITATENTVARINDIFGVIEESSSTLKDDILKGIKNEFSRLSAKFKGEIDAHSTRILDAIHVYSEKMDRSIKEVFESINSVFEKSQKNLEESINSTKSAVISNVLSSIEALLPKITSMLESKKNEIIKVIDEKRDTVHTALFDKIRNFDNVISGVQAGLGQMKEVAEGIISSLEKPISEAYERGKTRILDSIGQAQENIKIGINDDFQKLNQKTKEFLGEVDAILTTTETTIRESVFSIHEDNIKKIDEALNSFENVLKDGIVSLRDPINAMIKDLEQSIDHERKAIVENVTSMVSRISSLVNEIAESSKEVPTEIEKAISKFVDALKARPKGLFIVYGLDVINTMMADIAGRAKEVLMLICPVYDERFERIINNVQPRVLVEIFTSSIISKSLERAFAVHVPELPQNVVIIARDGEELLLVVEDEKGKYMGAVFEGDTVKGILKTVMKGVTRK